MASPITTRALLGTGLVGFVLLASLLVSPSATVGVLESVAGDPYRFGLAVAVLYTARPLFAWPTTPLAVLVGYGYGAVLGLPVALLGVSLTVIPTFLVVRWLVGGSDRAAGDVRPLAGVLGRSRDAVDRYYDAVGPVRGVVASRLAPIPSDVATAAAAVSGVRLRHLVVGTALGELPWTVAAVFVGASAATLTSDVLVDGVGQHGFVLAGSAAVVAVALFAPSIYSHLRTGSTVRTSFE
ncbi:TVP38/TMEM64 family protein [Natronosalvus halobius]|uniref:TVP38/TMEM64 family protein n=1 Tax=Natronosalvus halobius TaxID=2953746 RepID=UPI00209E816E|nr:VTT domain-containing protein [Natronosalvus halobius]USZ72508.1 VTT domain-containing protein [Natronosalvus halobius]